MDPMQLPVSAPLVNRIVLASVVVGVTIRSRVSMQNLMIKLM